MQLNCSPSRPWPNGEGTPVEGRLVIGELVRLLANWRISFSIGEE